MRPRRTTVRNFIIICICFWCQNTSSLFGQNQNHLVPVGKYDHIDSYQFISDSIVRVFGITGQHDGFLSGFGYSIDYDLTQPLSAGKYKIIGEGECFFNFGLSKLHRLYLNDGASIIGLNPKDCDYWPQGGIVRYNKKRTLDWMINFSDLEIYDTIESIVFVDSNKIWVRLGDEALFINRDGEIITSDLPDEIYKETIQTDFGYIGRRENQIELLDPAFNLIASHIVFDVYAVNEIRKNEYLVRSPLAYFILDNAGQLRSLPLSPQEFDFVWRSDSVNWAIGDDGRSVVEMDSSFLPLFTHELPPGVNARIGVSYDDIVFTGTTYTNHANQHILAYNGKEEVVSYELPQDVGVTQIEIPDTILVEFLNLPFYGGGWIQHFDFINVEVTNFGVDTVREFTIQNQAISQCGWCTYSYRTWEIDSLVLPPGASKEVILGSYVQDCIYNNLTSLCLTAVTPNQKADGNYLNDEHCEPFSFLINTESPGEPFSFQIEPNPANDRIRILVDHEREALQGNIFDSNGRRVTSFKMNDFEQEVDVADFPGGFYFLQLIDGSKGSSVIKFVVQH